MSERFNAVSERVYFKPVYHAHAFRFPEMPVIINDNHEKIKFFKWGLIPEWIKDDAKADDIKKFTLNARAETIFEKPSFRNAVFQNRCLIPATGFFEWQHINKEKIPYFIRLKDRDLFSFAGLWSIYNIEENKSISTFSIITSEANEFAANIHNTKKRMPVILTEDEEKDWLKNGIEKDHILNLIQKKEHSFTAYTVSKSLGKKGINTNSQEILEEKNYGNIDIWK